MGLCHIPDQHLNFSFGIEPDGDGHRTKPINSDVTAVPRFPLEQQFSGQEWTEQLNILFNHTT